MPVLEEIAQSATPQNVATAREYQNYFAVPSCDINRDEYYLWAESVVSATVGELDGTTLRSRDCDALRKGLATALRIFSGGVAND